VRGLFCCRKLMANYACSKSVGARDRADGGLAIGRVGKGRAELRIHYGPRYQLDLAQHGATLNIQLCGGDKSTQQNDIERAKRLARELEEPPRGRRRSSRPYLFLVLLRRALARQLIPDKTEVNGSPPHMPNRCLIGLVYQTLLLCCYRKHLRDLMQHERGKSLRPRAMSV
jgi:putative addiction module killer protein